MLKSDLYFHPDASRRESLRLGTLLFLKTNGTCAVGFFPAEPSALFQAQKLSDSTFFRDVFANFTAYVESIAATVEITSEYSEEQLANAYISVLPHNLQADKPSEWPPLELLSDGAKRHEPIMLHEIHPILTAVKPVVQELAGV